MLFRAFFFAGLHRFTSFGPRRAWRTQNIVCTRLNLHFAGAPSQHVVPSKMLTVHRPRTRFLMRILPACLSEPVVTVVQVHTAA